MTPLALVVDGEGVELWPQRALYWPARSTLLVADLHLGKGDAFRRAGPALPRGGPAADLPRLDDVLSPTRASRVLIHGDVLHGAVRASAWVGEWKAWRDTHAGVAVEAVVGNHDRALRQAALGIVLHEGVRMEPPFAFRHEPFATPGAYAWAGHRHPVLALPGLPRRVPAFQVGARLGVLPAFSAFTGGCEVGPAPGERLFACAGDAVVPVGG
jgi:DNA ligase-associated metallophosphoesterase